MRIPRDTVCLRCGHKWQRRVRKPVTCSRCKSPSWDKPRKKKPQNIAGSIKKGHGML